MRFLLAVLLWCILLVLCWPLAIGLLFISPLLLLILVPLGLVGAAFRLVGTILLLPFRILGL